MTDSACRFSFSDAVSDDNVTDVEVVLQMMMIMMLMWCRFTPVPDSVLNKNVALGDMNTTAVDPRGLTTPFPGDMTPGFNTPASM